MRVIHKLIFIELLVVMFAFLFIPSMYAEAHSALEKTYPKADTTIKKAPETVELWFQDPVVIHKDSVTVTNSSGKKVQEGQAYLDEGDPSHVIVNLTDNPPPGKYTVAYSVITPDGYVLKSRYGFQVKKPAKISKQKVPFQLKKANPRDGVIVETSPKQMELWFTRPAKVTAFGVFDDKKQPVPHKKPVVDRENPNHVIVQFGKKLDPGTYQVSWYAEPRKAGQNKRSFETQGVFYFAVNQVTAIAPTQGTPTSDWLKDIGTAEFAYWIAFIGLFGLFGGAWFHVMVAKGSGNQKRWKKTSLYLYITGILGLIFVLVQRRLEFEGLSFTEFALLKFAWIPVVQIILLTVGFWLVRGRWRLLFIGVSALLWPFFSGHSTYPRYGGLWSVAVDALHLLALSIWMGGLIALIALLPKKEEAASWLRQVGPVYSRWAFWSIAVIIITGVTMTLDFVPSFSWDSLMMSHWGKSLVAKSVLLILVMFLAFWQRRSLKHMAPKKLISFVGRARIELIFAVFILFAASMLVQSNPIAAEQGVYPKTVVKDGIRATVSITPLRAGSNEITVDFLDDPDFEKVRIKLFMPPSWRIENNAFSLGEGKYSITGNILHAAGTTYMKVVAFEANGQKIVFPFRIVVPGEMRLYDPQ